MSFTDEEDTGENDTEATVFLRGYADFTGALHQACSRVWSMSNHHRATARIVTPTRTFSPSELESMRTQVGAERLMAWIAYEGAEAPRVG
jgi:hypothetical protein